MLNAAVDGINTTARACLYNNVELINRVKTNVERVIEIEGAILICGGIGCDHDWLDDRQRNAAGDYRAAISSMSQVSVFLMAYLKSVHQTYRLGRGIVFSDSTARTSTLCRCIFTSLTYRVRGPRF